MSCKVVLYSAMLLLPTPTIPNCLIQFFAVCGWPNVLRTDGSLCYTIIIFFAVRGGGGHLRAKSWVQAGQLGRGRRWQVAAKGLRNQVHNLRFLFEKGQVVRVYWCAGLRATQPMAHGKLILRDAYVTSVCVVRYISIQLLQGPVPWHWLAIKHIEYWLPIYASVCSCLKPALGLQV